MPNTPDQQFTTHTCPTCGHVHLPPSVETSGTVSDQNRALTQARDIVGDAIRDYS